MINKLCKSGLVDTPIDTNDPIATQCEMGALVKAMIWKDPKTLLLYEEGLGFREAKFGMPRRTRVLVG